MKKIIIEQEKQLFFQIPTTFKRKRFVSTKKKNRIFSFIVLCLFFMSYYFYYLSLERCLDGFDICGMKSRWILKKLTQAIISYIMLAVLLELMILKIISKLHLLHIIIIYKLFYNYSHGLDFHDHGYFNFAGFIYIVSLILIIFLPFNGLLLIYKKCKKYSAVYICFLFLLFFYYLYFSQSYMNCNDWPKGLNNTYIENDIYIHGCKIKLPKICPYKLGKYVFDFTKWKNVKCHNNKENTKQILLQYSNNTYTNESTKKFGFPLVNKNPDLFLSFNEHNNSINKYVKENIIDMDNLDLVNKFYKENKPELLVDYTKNPFGEIIINLNYNETLSQERKKLEKTISPYANNIIILYIDSISRAYSIRQLKKTLKFFEQFMSFKGGFNKKFPLSKFHSFQFFKYHSFNGYTFENYPRIFYGNRPGKNIIRIIKYFKDNGFVTSYSNELCFRDLSATLHKMSYEEIGDHELIICDPNKKHANSLVKRCLYNKLATSYLYEYGSQFWRKYIDNRKFLIIASNDGHEGTLEILKYLDNLLFSFLNSLYNDNLLKETTIFLLSDHGTALPSPYYASYFYSYERFLPMLYIICNDRKNISYNEQYKYIYKNQQILITGYDIYNTIANLLYGNKYELIQNKSDIQDTPKSKYGQSLFNKINSKNRFPRNYNNMSLDICI